MNNLKSHIDIHIPASVGIEAFYSERFVCNILSVCVKRFPAISLSNQSIQKCLERLQGYLTVKSSSLNHFPFTCAPDSLKDESLC